MRQLLLIVLLITLAACDPLPDPVPTATPDLPATATAGGEVDEALMMTEPPTATPTFAPEPPAFTIEFSTGDVLTASNAAVDVLPFGSDVMLTFIGGRGETSIHIQLTDLEVRQIAEGPQTVSDGEVRVTRGETHVECRTLQDAQTTVTEVVGERVVNGDFSLTATDCIGFNDDLERVRSPIDAVEVSGTFENIPRTVEE